MPHHITLNGRPVPVVTFYSVSGGVGKSTLSRKFAELVTLASGQNGQKPNVLLVDLDVEAMGLTYRLTQGSLPATGTVHEALANNTLNAAIPVDVTRNVSVSAIAPPAVGPGVPRKKARAAPPTPRGNLYLLAAAPSNATNLFNTIKMFDQATLTRSLETVIQNTVTNHSVSCVVIDCEPGASPYSAAGAALADVPLLIGRNELTTYRQINVLASRLQELANGFQRDRQKVIINNVACKTAFEGYGTQYTVDEWIPHTSDVIHDTEAGTNTRNLRTLLFENYIIDLIRKYLIGYPHLVPDANEVLPDEWLQMVRKMPYIGRSPKVRLYRRLWYLIPVGVIAVVLGLGCFIAKDQEWFGDAAGPTLTKTGIGTVALGLAAACLGWYTNAERHRIERVAAEFQAAGPDEVFKRLKGKETDRRILNQMKTLADSIPIPDYVDDEIEPPRAP